MRREEIRIEKSVELSLGGGGAYFTVGKISIPSCLTFIPTLCTGNPSFEARSG